MFAFKDQLAVHSTEIDELQRLIRNYKAGGPSWKTKRYLNDKEATFAESFRTIKLNHKQLIKEKRLNDNQDHFEKKTYEELEKLYLSALEKIENRVA